MIPYIEEYLKNRFLIDPVFILLESKQIRQPELSTIAFLVKKREGSQESPFAIIKIPRYAGKAYAVQSLVLEKSNLGLLSAHLNSTLMQTVPSVLFMERIEDFLVLAESCVKGSEMSSAIWTGSSVVESFFSNLSAAAAWLASFENSFKSKTRLLCDITTEVLNKALLAAPQTSTSLLSKARNTLDTFTKGHHDKRIISVPQHGDYHASNIFVDKNEVSGVIDWEDFSMTEHPPCYDFIHFVFTYIEALYENFLSSESLELTRELQTSNAISSIINSQFDIYCAATKNDPELITNYILLYLLESLRVAADPRKMASGAINKLMIFLSFSPKDISELVFCMAYKNYVVLSAKYNKSGKLALEETCKSRAREIKGMMKQ